ncbi:unnamed protein product, partial [Symbiodinium natans]
MRPRGKLCPAFGPDFVRSLPAKLKKLDLFADLSQETAMALLGCLPAGLLELNMHIGDCLKWNAEAFRSFAEGFPRQLRLLDFDLEGDLRGFGPLAAELAASGLTTLRLSFGSVQHSEALAELFAALPPSLTELQLLMQGIGLSDNCCEELGRGLRRLTCLRALELHLEHCPVGRVLQAPCRSLINLELSLWTLGPADAIQLSNFVNGSNLQRLGLYLEGPHPQVCRALTPLPASLEELDFNVWDRSVGGEAVLTLASELPPRLRVLHLHFLEADIIPAPNIETLLASLPTTTLHTLSLSFEWSGFCQLTECSFPKKLRNLSLSGCLVMPERPPQVPFVAALARELPRLRHLRTLTLDFDGCCWKASEARAVLDAAAHTKKIHADFGTGCVEEDTPETWKALLGPFQAQLGHSLRTPTDLSEQTLY